MERGFPNPVHASPPQMYIAPQNTPPPQNTPRRSQPIHVRRDLFPVPMADFWPNTPNSPDSPNMLTPYDGFHQPSPTALLYRLTQHIPLQEHVELILGALSDATQHSVDNEVSIGMDWVNDDNDEELIRHMNAYEEDEEDAELIRHMNAHEEDEEDKELNRLMDTYECCTPVLRKKNK